MTKEEAMETYRRLCEEIGCYDSIRNSPEFYDVTRAAIECLMEPTKNAWVKTADRFPEGKDAFEDKVLVYNFVERRQQLKLWLIVRTYPHVFPYWMPIPPLPEVEL